VIDCNRYPDAIDAMPAVSDGIAVPANAGLSDAARTARTAEIFEPYHRVIATMLDKAERLGHAPVLLSIHSCNPVLNGASRPWEIGLGWVRDARTAPPLLDALRRTPGLEIGDNEPYGLDLGLDFTTPEHAMARGLAHVQVEFRNDLIADEAGAIRYADIFHDALIACAGDPRWHTPETYLLPSDGVRGMARFVGLRDGADRPPA
jgi:predicted N-formylglutamate amidohydrolase